MILQPVNRHSIAYESLRYRPYAVGELKARDNHPVGAIDTETYQGAARLIADHWGNYLLEPDADAILSFLTHNRFRKRHTFAYNLQYDAEAILKLLPTENLQEITADKSTTYNVWTIKYIPKKLLTVKDRHRNTSRFFDLAQFFETSLDAALQKYLGMKKREYEHRAALNIDLSIWESEIDQIIAYNKDDAYKTAVLGEFLQHNVKRLFNFNPRSYISKASLAKDLVRLVGYLPDVKKIPRGALKYAFYAYKGGRFEVLQRGYFPHVRLYDINSAYPYTIRSLIDVTKGQWDKVREMTSGAYYGFYLCSVFAMPRFICPVAYILPNKVICFPAGWVHTYLTRNEIEAYEKHTYIEVRHGWEFTPDEIIYPFREYVDKLFAQKQLFTKEDYEYDLVKKMMNSVYGCFYEKNDDGGRLTAGLMFNPVYASIITADTRAALYKAAMKHEEKNIAMATDSLMTEGDVRLKTSKELGGWHLESEGDAVVLQSGLYQIAGKLRTRGIQRASRITIEGTTYADIFTAIKARPDPTAYTITQERPLHLRECMAHTLTRSRDDINVWHTVTKTININNDVKRRWHDEFKRGGDIFSTSHTSEPWQLYKQ